MRMNRRNVLVGLGTIVAGGGAALGTGAFSQVQADRTATVTTSGDGSALLGIDVETTYNGISNGGGDVVQIDFVDLNDNAITTFDAALTITNNGSEEVELSVSGVPSALTFENASGADITSNPQVLSSGTGSVDITIVVDLKNNSVPSDTDITLNAQSTS